MRNSSLFPYLQSGRHPFSLKISLHSENPSILEISQFPFLIIHDSDPYARLLEAKLLTNLGVEFCNLFLLVQKDQYRLPHNELWPVTNKDVEKSWLSAFNFHQGVEQKGSLILLADQIGVNGEFKPLQSLLFCKTRKVFFHPLCPRCGLALQLCTEDEVLQNCGLPLYSASLKRYLFCPACFLKGVQDFYGSEPDRSDPSQVKDLSILIREFGQIQEAQVKEEPFPCSGCPKHGECYSPAFAALTRISPFSFYPFYMFLFRAPSGLQAADFLSLVSGASFEEIETRLEAKKEFGRSRYVKSIQEEKKGGSEGFLEKKGEGEFGEILYLKLSFLEELIRNISSRGGFQTHPDLRLNLDRIWVRLSNPGSLLPFLWNFQIDLIEAPIFHSEGAPFLPSPKSKPLYFLGCLWFYALLVNKKQTIIEVYKALADILEKTPANPDLSAFLGNSSPAFLPENIFWDPGARKTAAKWAPLWEKSLGLGLALLRSSLDSDLSWQEEDFLNLLDSLRREVRESLFAAEAMEGKPEIPFENEGLVKVLSGILQKWQKKPAAKEDGFDETMIIPGGKAKRSVPSREEVMETVILSPKGRDRRDSVKEDLEKTVILSKDSLKGESSKHQPRNISIENTTQTVVISPHDRSPESPFSQFSRNDPAAQIEAASEEKVREDLEEDDLAKTVILKATTKERKDPKD